MLEEAAGALGVIPWDQEVRAAMEDFKPREAPGLDGLHPMFFQENWDIVGNSLVREVRYGC